MFYVTPLDVSCSAVLGHSWLTCYNPLIDWVSSSISFWPPKETESKAPPESVTPVPLNSVTPTTNISWVNAVAFARASKLADVQIFKLFVVTTTPTSSETIPVDVSNVPAKYHDFKDVFNKARADTLPAHQLYDRRIELEEGTTPSFGPIYLLSLYELRTLREFIDEYLAYGFIRDPLDICVLVYLDDILIYSNNSEDHECHVREVLHRLWSNKLYAHADKCSFHKDTVEYLGYILAPSGLTMDNNKVKVIQDWPEPQKVKDVQSFLGFANFYRRFIHN